MRELSKKEESLENISLSVIIVNYNVKYFLEQCLFSVQKAVENIEAEVFVVDNNSVDGSCQMVSNKFPEVKLIANTDNKGFSRANNQAMRIAKGKYILLLNPDTIVQEDTFEKVIKFADENPDAGGIGVKMIDGNGNFLPESKRGLPTPAVAFYKIFGLSNFFPKSKTFGKYHLSYLSKEERHEIEILSGAFMFMRKEALDKVGLLDEDFFMYGEDIDLSYRIIKGGYKNYYLPDTTIIHYKGESTKKGSINYVFVFYNAMIIFAKKHFSQKNAKLFSFLINIAIYFRAGLAIFKRFLQRLFLPVFDSGLIFLGFWLIKPYWENYIFGDETVYPKEFLQIGVPTYIFIWLISVFIKGGYDRPIKLLKIIKGIFLGTIVILTIYALLPLDWRFSRALILLGSLWALFTTIGLRFVMHKAKFKISEIDTEQKKRIAIVGNEKESQRIFKLLQQTEIKPQIIGTISIKEKQNNTLGNISRIKEIIKINRIHEIIFSAHDLSSQEIIQKMLELADFNIDYKIASPDSISIIGSNSIDTAGDFYTLDINSIAKQENKRNKRIVDIITSVFLLMLFPIILFLVNEKIGFIKNIFKVLFGKKSWVGYYKNENKEPEKLPKIKDGILTPLDHFRRKEIKKQAIEKINIIYAKDYKVSNDLFIIFKSLNKTGRQ